MIAVKNIFGTSYIPKINFGYKEFNLEARKLIGKMSISGLQKKLSLKLDPTKKQLITAAEKGEYILKPQLNLWEQVPENEELCMCLAEIFSIETPKHTLIPLKDKSIAYIVKRFDRAQETKIGIEDFCQILGAKPQDKYKSSFEKIGKAIKKFSAAPGLDVILLFRLVLFNFLINNGDGHLKNFALIRLKHGYRLSPAFDLVNTKIIIPDENEETALTINGKKAKLNQEDFMKLAKYLEIPEKAIKLEFKRIFETKKQFLKEISNSSLSKDYIAAFKTAYQNRLKVFKPI